MSRRARWAAVAAALALVALGAVLMRRWPALPTRGRAPTGGVRQVLFTPSYAVLVEVDGEGRWLVVVELASLTRRTELLWPRPLTLLAANDAVLWVDDGGLVALSPLSFDVLADTAALAIAHPTLAPQIRAPRGLRFDAASGALAVGSDFIRPPEGRPPEAGATLHALGAARLREAAPPRVDLGSGVTLAFLDTASGRDTVPTLSSPTTPGLRLNTRLSFAEGGFLVDDVSRRPFALANPPSVYVLDRDRRRLSRLALHGSVLWERDDTQWGGGPVHAAILAHKRLVVWAGERLLAFEPREGAVTWEYQVTAP